jgi:hypothetical protein
MESPASPTHSPPSRATISATVVCIAEGRRFSDQR